MKYPWFFVLRYCLEVYFGTAQSTDTHMHILVLYFCLCSITTTIITSTPCRCYNTFSVEIYISHIYFCRTYYPLYLKRKCSLSFLPLNSRFSFLTMADTEQRFPSHRAFSLLTTLSTASLFFTVDILKSRNWTGFDTFHFIWEIKEIQGWKFRDVQRVIGIYDSSCSFVFCKVFLLILKADHSVKSIAEKKYGKVTFCYIQ